MEQHQKKNYGKKTLSQRIFLMVVENAKNTNNKKTAYIPSWIILDSFFYFLQWISLYSTLQWFWFFWNCSIPFFKVWKDSFEFFHRCTFLLHSSISISTHKRPLLLYYILYGVFSWIFPGKHGASTYFSFFGVFWLSRWP